MTDLSALIERLERAEGPDRHIDAAIYNALPPSTDAPYLPAYTSSIDAAVALAELVLPGEPILMGAHQSSQTLPWARVGKWSGPDTTARTLSLAVVLATLRALQSKGEAQ